MYSLDKKINVLVYFSSFIASMLVSGVSPSHCLFICSCATGYSLAVVGSTKLYAQVGTGPGKL